MGRITEHRVGGASADDGPADAEAEIGRHRFGGDDIPLEIEFIPRGEEIVVGIEIEDPLRRDGGRCGACREKGFWIAAESSAGHGLYPGLGADGRVRRD